MDGCFWHGCPEHGTKPRRNAEYWETKIARNRARDADTDARLEAAGWTTVRVWEHEEPDEAADHHRTTHPRPSPPPRRVVGDRTCRARYAE